MRGDPRVAKAFCPLQVCGQKTISKILVTFLLSSFAVCSLAQQRPDPFSSYKQQQQLPEAGSTYKQIEQGLRLPMPSLSEEKKAEEPKEANTSVLSVSVTKFNVLGNTLLSQLQIDEVLNPYVGKSLTFEDLQKVVQILIEQ